MDVNVKWHIENKVRKTMEALEKNNMDAYYVESNEQLIKTIENISAEGEVVSCGGSMTLFETGVMDHLRSGRYKFLDRYEEGLTGDQIKDIYRAAFTCDSYFISSNAVTEDGELYNVDGNGNRVAAMLFGPDKVIVVCGINKIVANVEEAIARNKNIVAPINAKRLDRKTPCTKVGRCMDCKSPERICRKYTLIKSQGFKGRMHVIFVNQNLGY